jgi:membrane protease subunit HflK
MEEVLPGIDKVIIDGKAGERLLPFLPLDRLQKPVAAAPDEKK